MRQHGLPVTVTDILRDTVRRILAEHPEFNAKQVAAWIRANPEPVADEHLHRTKPGRTDRPTLVDLVDRTFVKTLEQSVAIAFRREKAGLLQEVTR